MKILLVKLSSLGDVVHALPVVQDIRRALPDAQIDWVVERSFARLLSRCANLHDVIPCEIRRWRKSFWAPATRSEWRAFKARLQQTQYDAVIDLQGLTKSAVVARLARLAPGGKRYALANQTEGSGYEAPTRWVADVAIPMEPHIHAVQRSRELAARALGYSLQGAPDFGLNAAPARSASTPGNDSAAGRVVFVHGTSRADKEWPLAHWVELGRRLINSGSWIALAHGSTAELATSRAIADALNRDAETSVFPPVVVLPLLPLDGLTQQLSQSSGVIGVDSGVSHIAVALDLLHVQLYNFDTAWRTGPLPASRQVSVFSRPVPSVDAVWRAWQQCGAHRSGVAA